MVSFRQWVLSLRCYMLLQWQVPDRQHNSFTRNSMDAIDFFNLGMSVGLMFLVVACFRLDRDTKRMLRSHRRRRQIVELRKGEELDATFDAKSYPVFNRYLED